MADEAAVLQNDYLHQRSKLYENTNLVKELTGVQLSRQYTEAQYFSNLKKTIAMITPEQVIENDPDNYKGTPRIEVNQYVETAKRIAYCALDILLQGTFLALDTDLVHPKIYKTKEVLKEAAQSFVDEVNILYVLHKAPFLKFDEVEEGIAHLEVIIAAM